MTLDPQARIVLDQMASTGIPASNELSVSEAWQDAEAMAAMQGPPESVARIENRILPGPGGGIPIGIYSPFGGSPFPVVMYFHTRAGSVGRALRRSYDNRSAQETEAACQEGC
jgi:acetyl esterase